MTNENRNKLAELFERATGLCQGLVHAAHADDVEALKKTIAARSQGVRSILDEAAKLAGTVPEFEGKKY